MSNLKLLKLPKKPKLPIKPKAGSSVLQLQNWIKRVKDMKAKYEARYNAIDKSNKQRKNINAEALRLGKVIAGIGSIDNISRAKTSAGKVKAFIVRSQRKAAAKKKATVRTITRYANVAGVKREVTKKAAPKRRR